MQSCSLVLPEKPAAIEFTEKHLLESIATTYQLNDDHSIHFGSVYKLHGNKTVKRIALPGGIFRFVRQPDGHIISALTNGSIGVVDNDLNFVHILPVIDQRTLLSVSVCGNSVLCSDACGTLHVVDLDTGSVSTSFLGHFSPYTKEPCEVWTTLWHDTDCILSGGEDNLLKLWDLRSNEKQPVCVNRSHQCGVISLQKEDAQYILSGSYDDHLRRIDLRNLSQSVLNKKMNGGVWNVRMKDENSYIVSCMYGGWAVVKKENFEILQANQELGENLLYDADFSPQASVIVSCTYSTVTTVKVIKQRLRLVKLGLVL